MNNIATNELYTFVLKNKLEVQGIVIKHTENWVLVKKIQGDFTLDGFEIIIKNYIKEIKTNSYNEFKKELLELRHPKSLYKNESGIKDSTTLEKIFNLFKEKEILISIGIKNPNSMYVGKIFAISEHSVKLHLISPNCTWLHKETFRYNEIRFIRFLTYYDESLKIYIDHQSKYKTDK